MPVTSTMWALSSVEAVLWALLGFLFWHKKLHKQFPAMGAYLAIRIGSIPVILTLLYGQSQHWFHNQAFMAYFVAYWVIYAASGVVLYFIALEVFRSVLMPFSGLRKFGTVIFRWVAIASLLIGVSTLNFSHTSSLLPAIFLRMMRSVSILELCLLTFLCLAMNALRLSIRDIAFGIALGFGIQASSDFIFATFWMKNTSLNDMTQILSELATLVSLVVWALYILLPARERNPVVVPATSTIYRWNEIASALGHKTPNLPIPQPASSFFLTDVEKVVEKVLAKNMKESETGS